MVNIFLFNFSYSFGIINTWASTCSVLEDDVKKNINSLLSLVPITNENVEEALSYIKVLRNMCSKGSEVQNTIVAHPQLLAFILSSLRDRDCHICRNNDLFYLLLWQLLANSVVNNEEVQIKIWLQFGDLIASSCILPVGKTTDVQLMILYNIFKGKSSSVSDILVLRVIVQLWQNMVEQKCNENFDYLHFIFEYFLVNNRSSVRFYAQLESVERIAFLNYMSVYLRNRCPNGAIGSFLLRYISKEFKMKSDCILRHSATGVEEIGPREAYGLLQIIAVASGDEQYSDIYYDDHALFLNVSSLLRCLVALGKDKTKNVFTPLNKLEEVAPASNLKYKFENEISFELKTLLVRSIGNMLYMNKTNVDYCVDTQLVPALLECTNMDARNPRKFFINLQLI